MKGCATYQATKEERERDTVTLDQDFADLYDKYVRVNTTGEKT